ncbi:methionine ABC transporter permease [Propionispira raffinosivorans]|uniref:methionine ABC transporter permease n=1 Tax=Propionispira raffinosivorans TaxID=86959 RepID=UPI00037E45EF|nr:methionine ABC transporter permease [Propionispira raffinosivorans]
MNNDLFDLVLTGLTETLYMAGASTIVALLIGLPFGVILVVTEKGNILESAKVHQALGTIVNIFRSFPSIILIVILLPLSRFLIGTTLGATAAIVPLSIGSAPFFARIIENCLKEVAFGKIEAALAMGASPFTIITQVLIPEALPSLIRGMTIAIIMVIGFTAVAGAIGGGGLGSLAIRFGYMRYRDDVMIVTVVILVLLVQGIQWGGDFIAKYIERKRYKFE